MVDRTANQERTPWQRLIAAKWPYLALGAGAVALGVAIHQDAHRCSREVVSTARTIERSAPRDPLQTQARFERLAYAADMCDRGQAELAAHVLDDLKSETPTE